MMHPSEPSGCPWPSATASGSSPKGGAGATTIWRWASGSLRASPPWGGSVLKDASTMPRFGSVTNLAARLCGAAEPWQVLASQRVFHAAEPVPHGRHIGELTLKGFSRPVRVFDVTDVSKQEEMPTAEGLTK